MPPRSDLPQEGVGSKTEQELDKAPSEEVLDAREIGPELRAELLQVITQSYHSGPLPSPESLQKYSEVLPDLPGRIVSAWEDETKHRRSLEVEQAKITSQLALRGQVFAASLSTMFFAGSMYLVATGHGLAGMGVIIAEIATLAGVFLYARRKIQPQEDPSETPAEDS